ncbi:MAG: copper chaperone PCu(A)C [Pseudomonadota bacterium]
MLRTGIALLTALFIHVSAASYAEGSKDAEHMPKHDVGELTLMAPFARATLPNQPVAGGFLTITNNGETDDVLMSVSSAISERGEVHEMAMEGDTMRMRQLADGLVIPAGATVELKPGGYHLMFMKLNQPLVEGEMMDATLMFKNAGSVTLPFTIIGKGAKSMDHSGHGS